ncbi:MAG: MBL fold metallo-hydrolase [Halieaceae bacterium]|nr:MBL fold metallo-hydrolase [Halieaceae bacterium]
MKKRTVILILLLLSAAFVYSQRGPIAKAIMARGAEARMTSNAVEDLEDGLHVVVCGAGGPLPSPNRSGPCIGVIAGEKFFVVDAGTNGLRNLVALGYPVGDIQAVLLTHFHSDHIDGLGEMATIRWVNGANTSPLPVIGPEGVQTVVKGFNTAYAQDEIYRNEHHTDLVAPLEGAGMNAASFPPPPEGSLVNVYEDGALKIQALAVEHDPVRPAVAYLFTYKDRSLIISGDTAQSANLEHFAQGVDLLLHEALSHDLVMIMHETAKKVGNEVLAKITFDILDYHASPVEAAETARDAGVGHLVYYHIVPPLVLPGMEAAWTEGVDDIFPNYTVSEDGTAISLPAGSEDIIITAEGM